MPTPPSEEAFIAALNAEVQRQDRVTDALKGVFAEHGNFPNVASLLQAVNVPLANALGESPLSDAEISNLTPGKEE